MITLNCRTFDDCLASLASATDVAPAVLLHAMRDHEPDSVPADQDPWEAFPRDVLATVGIDIAKVAFDDCVYFHGTRTLDSDSFLREGILPLGLVIDRLWEALLGLCPDVSDAEWAALRARTQTTDPSHSAELYRLKTQNPALHGPYASLVREHVLYPIVGQHDYLASPEIIEDIARCSGFDLQHRFDTAATMCIVAFRSTQLSPSAVDSAVNYAYAKARGEKIGMSSVDGYDCRAEPVAAHDVISVELITER
ncbi:hypothetical protein AB0H43_22275 [Hamadaea sp. NPDC050747]|uniref:hypothetical protein n=1 Tax=Hamadaea sp. NPDC050747 TaxID=3155789 RepID=UPI0033D6C3A4